jgi:hypothetical protein
MMKLLLFNDILWIRADLNFVDTNYYLHILLIIFNYCIF